MPDYEIVVTLTEAEKDELNEIMSEPTHMARYSFIKGYVTRMLQTTFDAAYAMGVEDGECDCGSDCCSNE